MITAEPLESAWRLLGERLRQLALLDPQRAVFGADHHGYRFGPLVGAEALAEVEARLGCALPADLATLYRVLGDGGAGPDYGIRAVGRLEALSGERPFPGVAVLRAAWTDPDGCVEIPDEALTGLIAIMDQGCGHRACLVTCGEHPGAVVFLSADGDVADGPPDLRTLYGRWLDEKRTTFEAVRGWMETDMDLVAIEAALRERRLGYDAGSIIASIADVPKPVALFGRPGHMIFHGATQIPWFEGVLARWRQAKVPGTSI